MLLLPTTLTALSMAGAALLPADRPGTPAAHFPAPLPVAQIGYLAEVHSGADGAPPFLLIASADDATDSDSGFGPAVDTASLDRLRGGDGDSASTIVMNGNVADNRATNVVTGANTITAGAFANASGVPMVVQNTGANVLIQNATVINLQLR